MCVCVCVCCFCVCVFFFFFVCVFFFRLVSVSVSQKLSALDIKPLFRSTPLYHKKSVWNQFIVAWCQLYDFLLVDGQIALA